jgi:hypothetical protein
MIRVYAVTKKNGKWDILNKAGVIPKTVETVHITWGDGKGNKKMDIPRDTFLTKFNFVSGCEWKMA